MEALQGGLLCQAADPVPSSLATHITAEQVGYFQAAADHLVVIKEFSSLQWILDHHPSPDQLLLLEVLVTNLFYAASTSSLSVPIRREVEVNRKQSKLLSFCHKDVYLQRFLDTIVFHTFYGDAFEHIVSCLMALVSKLMHNVGDLGQ